MSPCLHSYMSAFLKNEFCLSNSVFIAPSWATRKLGLGIRSCNQSRESVSSSADWESSVFTFVRVSGENDEVLHCLSLKELKALSGSKGWEREKVHSSWASQCTLFLSSQCITVRCAAKLHISSSVFRRISVPSPIIEGNEKNS